MRYEAPAGALTPALRRAMKAHKAELLAAIVSATKPLNPAVVLAALDEALRGLRHDPDGSRAWHLIDTDTELHGRFEAAERTIEAAQRDGDDSGMRAAVADYRGVIGEALAVWTAATAAVASWILCGGGADFEAGRLLATVQAHQRTSAQWRDIMRAGPSAAISEAARLTRAADRGRLDAVEAAVWAEFGRLRIDSHRAAARTIAARGVLNEGTGRRCPLRRADGRPYTERGIRGILERHTKKTK